MKQYIMVGIIAAGILTLAVFLFISLRTKKGGKRVKNEKSIFAELEENANSFPEDYKTELLTDREYGQAFATAAYEKNTQLDSENIGIVKIKRIDDKVKTNEWTKGSAGDEKNRVIENNESKKTEDRGGFNVKMPVHPGLNYNVENETKKADNFASEEYVIEKCSIKKLEIDEIFLKKINVKSCSIEKICLVQRDNSECREECEEGL